MSAFGSHKKIASFTTPEHRPSDSMGSAQVKRIEHLYITQEGHKPSRDELNAFIVQLQRREGSVHGVHMRRER